MNFPEEPEFNPKSEVKKGIVWLGGLWQMGFLMKPTTTTPHQTMHDFCKPLFASRQVHPRSALMPITRFGGLVSRISFFNKIGLPAQIGAAMPFCYRSPNAIAPAQTLVAFLIPVVAGARRLARTDWLRADSGFSIRTSLSFSKGGLCPALSWPG